MKSFCLKGEKEDSTTELILHPWGGELRNWGKSMTAPSLQVKGLGAQFPEVSFVSSYKQMQRLQGPGKPLCLWAYGLGWWGSASSFCIYEGC